MITQTEPTINLAAWWPICIYLLMLMAPYGAVCYVPPIGVTNTRGYSHTYLHGLLTIYLINLLINLHGYYIINWPICQ